MLNITLNDTGLISIEPSDKPLLGLKKRNILSPSICIHEYSQIPNYVIITWNYSRRHKTMRQNTTLLNALINMNSCMSGIILLKHREPQLCKSSWSKVYQNKVWRTMLRYVTPSLPFHVKNRIESILYFVFLTEEKCYDMLRHKFSQKCYNTHIQLVCYMFLKKTKNPTVSWKAALFPKIRLNKTLISFREYGDVGSRKQFNWQ